MRDLDCRKDWQRYRAAMKIIANRFGITVYCSQKYSYLNVNFHITGLCAADITALSTLEDIVMLVSEWPENVLQRLDPAKIEVKTTLIKNRS